MSAFWKRAITCILLISFMAAFFLLPVRFFSILAALVLGEILIFEWPSLAKNHLWMWPIAIFYLLIPGALIIIMNEQGRQDLVGLLLLTVGCFDMGAYLTGITFGFYKLCPKISPNKTWEGAFGGLAAVILVTMLLRLATGGSLNLMTILSFSLFVAIFATMGDLFESWLKRLAGLKDSGSLLPGHGGFLDRIDGLLLAGVLFYVIQSWISLNIL